HVLVERERAPRRQCRAGERVEQGQEEWASRRAEVEADGRRHQHHRHDARLGEREIVAQPAPRARGLPDGDGGRHAGTPLRTPTGSTPRRGSAVTRAARSVRTRQVARRAAPTTRCAVVGRTARRDQMVSAPRVTWRARRLEARSAGRWSHGPSVWRRTWTAVEPTASATTSAPTRCAKWTAM